MPENAKPGNKDLEAALITAATSVVTVFLGILLAKFKGQ